ncbi:MAG: YraN family protein [Clostridia bacterium]|nr:YraN family protein [Clostridia bacterium]
MHNKNVGKIGEDIACKYLIEKGYAILERNYVEKGGEIDIIARNGREIIFVEVKARCSKKNGDGIESITWQKIRHIKNVSKIYILKKRLFNYSIRYDAIDINFSRTSHSINHIKAII